ncbi:tripartite tricarboxylate transporter substrate binding protein [Rhodobacteraceae bacterium M385]|nr:tripartite tricarboxylate transporter substrate binding protein [Rhodobacteraceae bacterium M385]
MFTTSKFLASTVCVAAALTTGASFAQDAWPERAVTIIVPWSAGGGTDGTARAVAAELEERFGQPFNVVNRTGGGGLVGHSAIMSADSDGYTLGVITIEMSMYEAQGLSEMSPEDFTFIGRFNADPIAINVGDGSYADAQALIDDVRADPGALSASGANRGGLSHLAWVGLLDRLDIDPMAANWVASDGSAPALQQLAAGAIDVVTTSPAEASALVEAGEAQTLALVSSERSELYPDLPTTTEIFGVDWSPLPFRGLAAPAGIDESIVETLTEALAEITSDPEFREFMNSQGFSVAYQDAEGFATTVQNAYEGLSGTMAAVGLAN